MNFVETQVLHYHEIRNVRKFKVLNIKKIVKNKPFEFREFIKYI